MPIFTVLPRKSDPHAADAPAILRGIIREPVNVVFLILGKPSRVEEIIETAVGRAEVEPHKRRVVHVPDPEVLDADQLTEIKGDIPNTAAAVYGLDDRVVVRLKAGHARRRGEVERAFVRAGALEAES